MIELTPEEVMMLDKAANSFDGHITNGSSVAIKKVVEELILKYVREWTR